MLISRTDLPPTRLGFVSRPQVTIRENGQLLFSKAATKVLKNCGLAVIEWDPHTRALKIKAVSSPPKGLQADQCFTINYTSRTRNGYISASGLWKYLKYDYKEAGSQPFGVSLDESQSTVTFRLPERTPARRPTKPKAQPQPASEFEEEGDLEEEKVEINS
jgi:hypothetical protein